MTPKLPKRAVIVGSGWSIRNGDNETVSRDLPIWNKIKNEYTFGLNYAFRYMTPTVSTFVDFQFYVENQSALDKLPLIVGKYDGQLVKKYPISANAILIPRAKKYHGIDSWEHGFYQGLLNGLFSLTLVIALGFKEIYLLGFDANALGPNEETHFYQKEIDLREKGLDRARYQGVGKKILNGKKKVYNTSLYNSKASSTFDVYKQELKNIQIFNVSPNSNINVFPKITYDKFYRILEEEPRTVLQSRAVSEIEDYILKRIPEKKMRK